MNLEDVFRAHQKEVFVYFLRVLGDSHTAEDLTQETFVRAFRSALLFRGDSSIRTWLFAIARRVLASHLDSVRSDAPLVDADHAREEDPAVGIAIRDALERLPLAAREAIVLCDVIGLAPGEAAGLVGSTPGAFRVRLHRARTQFREGFGR